MKNVSKESFYLDNPVATTSYADVRDWVEHVVDGFNKGMKFDGMVDKKSHKKPAMTVILGNAKDKNKKQKPYKTYRIAG